VNLKAKNWITLTLTNDTSSDSDVELFKFNNSSSVSGQQTTVVDTTKYGTVITGFYIYKNDFAITYDLGTSITSSDVLKTALEEATGDVWTYTESGTDASFTVYSDDAYDPIWKYDEAIEEISTAFTDGTGSFILGSNIEVEMETGDLTYDEVVSDFMGGGYNLKYVNVFASSIAQANRHFDVIDLKTNGSKRVNPIGDAIKPTQRQNVLYNVEINYKPTPTNYLGYTTSANESVKLIFNYERIANIDLLEANSNESYSYLSQYKVAQEKLQKALQSKKTANKDYVKKLFGWK